MRITEYNRQVDNTEAWKHAIFTEERLPRAAVGRRQGWAR